MGREGAVALLRRRPAPSLTAFRRPLRSAADPAQAVLALATALAVAVPAVCWADVDVPGRALMVLAFVLLVPGVALAIWVTDDRRSLWAGLGPALSLVTWMVVTLAQALTNTMSSSLATSVVAVAHAAALPGAWLATGRRARVVPRSSGRRRRLAPLAVLALALAVWWQAVGTTDLDRAGAFGILQAAPATYWIALALVAGVAGWAVTRPDLDRVVLGASVVVLVVVAYAYAGLADGTPVVPNTFIHLGIADAIETLGFVPTGIDARFGWPAFFTGSGAALGAMGDVEVVRALVWYPVVVNVLCLPPLVVLGRGITGSERTGWCGAFVFVTLNWVQQDYFSPQSVAFFLFLVLLATLASLHGESEVRATTGRGPLRLARLPLRTVGRPVGWSGPRLVALELVLVVLGMGLAVGHQLTPVAAIAVLGGLSALGVTRLRTLWISFAVLFLAWFAFGATDWWTGHLAWLLGGFGQVQEAVTTGGLKRVAGDPWYARLQLGRVAWSAAVAAVAGVGWLTLRRRPGATFAVACVLGPVLLVGGQPYGGEILLRTLLYTSPVLAVLAAQALMAARDRWPRPSAPVVVGAFVLAAVALTTTRGVNVAFERNPPDVVAAAEVILAEAPPRARISPLRAEPTLQVRRLREVDSPQGMPCARTPLECILRQQPDYVFLTSTRDHYDELRNGSIPGYSRRLASQLLTSGRYRVRIDAPHVVVLQNVDLVPRPKEVPS